MHDWQGDSPSHFCLRFRHSSHACFGQREVSARAPVELTVAVRLAFCLGCTWLGVIGTAGNFVVVGPYTCGGGGVAGPSDALHDDDALLEPPKESPGAWI